MPETTTEPTGLDYHAAYKAMFPALAASTVRLNEINDRSLKVVDRAARLRREERERVKAAFSALATQLEIEEIEATVPGIREEIAERIRKTIEEIR